MPTKIFIIYKVTTEKLREYDNPFLLNGCPLVKLHIIIFVLDYLSYERTNIVQLANETNCTTAKFHSN